MKANIEFRDAAGEITKARYARPCLRIEASWPGHKTVTVTASIDTGAGRSFIQPEFIPKGYVPSELDVPVRSAHGETKSCLAFKTLIGLGGRPEFAINLVAMDLKSINIDMLIGLDFLSHGIMVLDFRNPSLSSFEAYGNN